VVVVPMDIFFPDWWALRSVLLLHCSENDLRQFDIDTSSLRSSDLHASRDVYPFYSHEDQIHHRIAVDLSSLVNDVSFMFQIDYGTSFLAGNRENHDEHRISLEYFHSSMKRSVNKYTLFLFHTFLMY
jgi:hypothetical protein